MATTVPARRLPTRTTRSGAAVKENENAVPRPSRVSTRTKAGATSTTTLGATSGLGKTTFASRAKTLAATGESTKSDAVPIKRKREALGEVTVAGNRAAAGKGKEKEITKEAFEGVVIKTKQTVAPRQPLRTVTTRQTAQPKPEPTRLKKEKAPLKESAAPTSDHAMSVDPPIQDPLPPIAVRRAAVVKDAKVIAPKRNVAKRTSGRLARREIEDVEEEERVFKKRRTSSEAPEPESKAEEVVEEDPEVVLARRIEAEMEAFANEAEADPENSPWEDLDADDADDPLLVSEYVIEIFNYMKQMELTTMPNPNYMESQKELAWKMRGILTDWLVQVHVRFRLLPETLFLAVNIIDRFLSARVVSLAKLQLVGITCLFIASKVEEIISPGVGHFLSVADSTYTAAEILQAERYVLKTLDWNLSYPNPVHFLRRISKADDYNVAVRTLGKYLIEIGCLEWRLIAAPPSLMAAAGIWLARLAMGFEEWTPNLAHYSSYRESEIIPTANLMLNYILKPVRHEAFYKKYAGKRFSKACGCTCRVYMHDWATARWPENSQVDLSRELPRLKALVKLEREAAEQVDSEGDFLGEGETFVKRRIN
ncbi:A/B/D/E cyclin [Coprinopsis marcescibilis]|uniref:A/B/D/E cyclin n=1 Tax=Coprinopsis marcescibilis TaxID=230819 RepID=A0A5C3KKD4_COPMA|nr:A/B/D/E cyclin [Coprinopsis marcescibilis]